MRTLISQFKRRENILSKLYLRRSLLYVPGSSEKMLLKAETVSSDAVIIDLEDSVSHEEKDIARERAVSFLSKNRVRNKEVIVRINGMDTIWGPLDLQSVIPLLPDSIVLPKADERSIACADMIISAIEDNCGFKRNTVKMIALFETAYSIINSYFVLGSSSRINGVQLGGEDLTKEQEVKRTMKSGELFFARASLAMAARARQVDILDTPCTDIFDLESLRYDAELVRDLGFTGKTCIHPSHIDIINDVFSPSEEDVTNAKSLIDSFRKSQTEGSGAYVFRGKMVDAPIVERAAKIIEKHKKIVFLEGERK